MIVCKKCGTHNADQDAFCSSCGAFLEWSGERVPEPTPPPPSPAPPATPPAGPPPGFVQRVRQAVGMDEQTGAPPASPPAGGGWAPPGPSAPPTGPSSPPPPGGPAGQGAQPPAPAPPAQTPASASTPQPPLPSPPGPPARQPQAVPPAPQTPRPAPRTPTLPPGQAYEPGDLICGQCGAGNNSSRHFCRRCGASLAEAATVKVPWWRRLRRAREVPIAGRRPQKVRPAGAGLGAAVRTTALTMIGLVVAGALLAYAVVPGVRAGVEHRVQQAVRAVERPFCAGTTVAVRPVRVQASASLPGHPAEALIDLVNTDYWAADAGTQPVISLFFAAPTDIDYMLVTSGAAADFAKLARPKDVRLSYPDGSQQELTLKDDPKSTCYTINAHRVTQLSMRILSVYPTAQSTAVAIAELELFRLA